MMSPIRPDTFSASARASREEREPWSEAEILRAVADGTLSGALERIIERYAGLVYGVAWRRTGQHELAQEVAQNVFAVLARKAAALARTSTPLAAWLHRATVLEAAQRHRNETTRRRAMKEFAVHTELTAPSATPVVLPESLLPELDEALDALPRADRELLLARYFEDRSYRELAAATGRSEAALMQQHHRALEKLARLFRKRGFVVPSAALAAGLGAPLAAAAPSSVVTTLAAAATTAAPALGLSTSLALTLAMQTKTQLALAVVAVYLVAGAGSFFIGRAQGIATAEDRLAAVAATTPATETTTLPERNASGVVAPLGLHEKLAQAVAAWRAADTTEQQRQALAAIDALAPPDIAEAFAFLETVRTETALFQDLARRLSQLRAAHEPEAALAWLGENLPRQDNGLVVRAIVTAWAERDPRQALAWWQRQTEVLDFPGPENHFENLPQLIFRTWAHHDPAGLIRELNATAANDPHHEAMETGLGMALSDPAGPARITPALSELRDEKLKQKLFMIPLFMSAVVNPAKAREQAVAVPLQDVSLKNELLLGVALLPVMMQTETGGAVDAALITEICTWARRHMDAESALKALEHAAGEFAHLPPETLALLKAELSAPPTPSPQ